MGRISSQLSPCTLSAGVFLKAREALPALQGLSGDRRGLGSLSPPAADRWQVPLYVLSVGFDRVTNEARVTPAVPRPILTFH